MKTWEEMIFVNGELHFKTRKKREREKKNKQNAWPMEILIPLFSFSDNLHQNAYILLQESVDKFEIVHKASSIWLRV